MASYSFDWVDAFTTQAFGGNACAVVHGADNIGIDDRLQLVRETSLSECAYLVASDRADFGARYYLADREIPLAGHPTIATVTALLSRGRVPLTDGRAAFTLELGVGVVDIEVETTPEGFLVTMTQPAPIFGPTFPADEIAGLYGLEPADVIGTPQLVSTGTAFCIAVLSGQTALRRARLDVDALLAWRDRLNSPSAAMIEPFLVTLGGATEQGDTFSRLLLPPPLPAEDPFTGSATGCMAAYLWAHGMIDTPQFIAEQGHWMGRPGTAVVNVMGPRDGITGVKVGGHGKVLMTGDLHL